MTNKELIEENKRLEAWIDDLQSGMWINCVYCGHRYGPNKGDHLVTMRKTLEKHIEECPKHPLSMARNRIMELEAENKRLQMMNPCNHTGYEAAPCDVCGYPDPRKLIAKLEEENQRLMDEIRDLEWKIYRPLKEGEMTQEGDQVLGPEEDAKWEPVAGNYRPAPSPLYPAHCQYRRPIVDELRKEMEGDYFYRKCVAGKESARSKRIKELEAERDADRRREYGYSQQTVDALTLERDKLRAERNDWIARYQSVSEMHDALIKEYNEGRAENKRLREALKYIAFTTPGPTMKTHSEAAEQALSVILSERDKEEIVRFVKPDAQAVERERDQWRDLCARQGMQLKNVERENGELKAEKIRIEKVMQLGCQDSESVCPYWQTVKDWEKECESLELKITNLQAALSAAQGEVERLRELVDGARVIVEVFQWSTPAQERWREEWLKKAAKALKEASDE